MSDFWLVNGNRRKHVGELLSNRLLVACIELELHAETGVKTVTVPMQGTHYHCEQRW